MEVILRQTVENVGNPGDTVKVSNGYARNYLLPHGLAYQATPGNLKRIAAEKARLEPPRTSAVRVPAPSPTASRRSPSPSPPAWARRRSSSAP